MAGRDPTASPEGGMGTSVEHVIGGIVSGTQPVDRPSPIGVVPGGDASPDGASGGGGTEGWDTGGIASQGRVTWRSGRGRP
jgi:hypothetical protein